MSTKAISIKPRMPMSVFYQKTQHMPKYSNSWVDYIAAKVAVFTILKRLLIF